MPELQFPPSRIEQAVEAPVTRYTRRVDILNADGTEWMTDVRFAAGRVSIDHTRDERRTADVVLYNETGDLDSDRNGGFWYDKLIKISMGVQAPEVATDVASGSYWQTSLGVFAIDKISSNDEERTISVSMRDKTKLLKFDLPFTLTFQENTPVENIVRDLAAAAGIGTQYRNLPLTGENTDIEVTFEQGKDRWSAMKEISEAHGYELWFDPDGVLQMTAFVDPATDQPQYTFQAGALSNLSKISRSASDTLIRNHIVVYGERGSGDDAVAIFAESFNVNPDSPTNTARLGLRTETIRSEWVTSFPQAQNLANHTLRFKSLESFDCNLDTIIIPWLEAGIVVEFQDPGRGPGDPTRFLLSSIDINLDLSPATAVVRRVSNVIDQYVPYPDDAEYPRSDLFPSYGPGFLVWNQKVRRAWTAAHLVEGAATWFPERGSTPLTLASNQVPQVLKTSRGHSFVRLQPGSYISGDQVGVRYGIVVQGNLTFVLDDSTYSSAIGSQIDLHGIIETASQLSAQEETDLAAWLSHEKTPQ